MLNGGTETRVLNRTLVIRPPAPQISKLDAEMLTEQARPGTIRRRREPDGTQQTTFKARMGHTCFLLSSLSCFNFSFSFSSSLFLSRMGALLPGVFLLRILAMASAQPPLAPTRASPAFPSSRSRAPASPSLSASTASPSEENGSSSGLQIPTEPTRRNKRNFTAGGRGGQGRCQTPVPCVKLTVLSAPPFLQKGTFQSPTAAGVADGSHSGSAILPRRPPKAWPAVDGGGRSGSRNKAKGRHHTLLSRRSPTLHGASAGCARVHGPRLCQ